MVKRFLPLAAVFALAFAACKPPKYIEYRSAAGDFSCDVPYAWQVFYDEAGSDYNNYTFVGPFDPDFYRGAPSLSVRWYARDSVHPLPLGGEESYRDADDFIAKTLSELYGEQAFLEVPVRDVQVSGFVAKHFVVSSPMAVGRDTVYGAARDAEGNVAVLRQHAYIVLPMDNGFYVLTYPATRVGFKKHEVLFNALVNTFKVYRDGPAGPGFR
ncbi:MAG: hypothetical protein WC969_11465 [Elusimicrobiota bacterium]